ncbi:claudin-15 isoform X2 [Salvelinus sp. IW2-2015]|uniref:claudin-15 isoform X2 n=1 Tax=Salvelinus sp. IW2-2015 TaxID=2691554 RepID=UPI000CDFBF07|nr:claudin-15 isoform X2 [Salvelinus alpinus]
MSTAVELTGFLLCVASWLLTGSSLANDYWKLSSVSGSVIISTRQFQNLFHSCAENSAGIRNCKDFESLLALPGYIQACRALMIIALLLGLASIIVSVLGLKCTKIGSTSQQVKGKITLTGGSLFILSGLSTLTAVSWYTARVVQEFHDPFFAGVRFELGTGLYMGWGAACLAILGGVMLCCYGREVHQHHQQGDIHTTTPKQAVYNRSTGKHLCQSLGIQKLMFKAVSNVFCFF